MASSTEYRPDIDGMRAIAVLSVMVFHAFPAWLRGGFVGVDVFFVISGYLISSLIFAAHARGEGLGDFYIRRIRRIFPAVILVLSASLIFARYALFEQEYKTLGMHVAASAGFVENLLLQTETGYFDKSADTKPLLHLWSLGVEEQFYITWPLLMLAVWKARLNVFRANLVFAATTFLVNLVLSMASDPKAYFMLLPRFWEFCLGILVACHAQGLSLRAPTAHASPLFARMAAACAKHRTALHNGASTLGTILLLAGIVGIEKSDRYPGAIALIPVAGTALLIAAGPKGWLNRHLFSARILVWIGLISFPLYLWHWVFLSFYRITGGGQVETGILLAVIALVFALSWLTYRYIETPIRHGGHGRHKAAGLLAAMTLVGVLGYFSIPGPAPRGDTENERDFSRQIGWTIPVANKEQIDWCNARFPERARTTDDPDSNNFCILQRNATPDVLMVGDSMNLSFFPGLAKYDDYNLLLLSASYAAPLYNIATLQSPDDSLRVANYKLTNQALDYALKNDNIKVVVMSFLHGKDIFSRYQPLALIDIENKSERPQPRVFAESLAATLNLLLGKGKKVIYVLPNPALDFEPTRCLEAFRPFTVGDVAKQLCAQPRGDHLLAGGQKYRDLVRDVLVKFPAVQVFDAAPPFCDEQYCWGTKNGKLLYRDQVHLSEDGSALVAPALHSLILDALGRKPGPPPHTRHLPRE